MQISHKHHFILLTLLGLFTFSICLAEEPNNNIVLAAAECWGTYCPGNVGNTWTYLNYKDDLSQRTSGTGNWLFCTTRFVNSTFWGNPGWGWMQGLYVNDWSNTLSAIEFNPDTTFGRYNTEIYGPDFMHYCYLSYSSKVPGADDPSRNYRIPSNGGAVLSADRTYAYGVAAWPTQLGVDVKMTVHSWTMPYANMDDFHLVEVELYNTGVTDLNGDGVAELHNNAVKSLVLSYTATVFGFGVGSSGGRYYFQPNSRFRAFGLDMTPDESGAPWNIAFQGFGSDVGYENFPGLADGGRYYDAFNGYAFLGAKKWDSEANAWVNKNLAFKDAQGREIVPAVGEGKQRGWFSSWVAGYNSVCDYTPSSSHAVSLGAFYQDGGKSVDKASLKFAPNENLFISGTAGDPTSFVVKEQTQWTRPDGDYKYTPAKMAVDPQTGRNLGLNPLDPMRGRPLEPGIITEGVITEYRFDGEPFMGMGPFSMQVGERIRVYFVRGCGFRMDGLRKTIKTARAVYSSMKPDGSFVVPQSPPVPEIKVNGSAKVRPLIKWQDPGKLGNMDGIKIYKCVAFPRYNSLYKGFPTHGTWWKTMDPAFIPQPDAYNPLFTAMTRLYDQQGSSWGPYDLVKVIKKEEFNSYKNATTDAAIYPYAWEDDGYTSPGQSYWYYVSSYKNDAASTVPAAYAGLEPDNVTWLESGKTNVNGRTGSWEATWPFTESHAYFPAETNTDKTKAVGARFVLVSPPATIADIEQGRSKIGVRPNPYKRVAWHDVSNQHQVMFYNLPSTCTIQIYDLAGMLINELEFTAPTVNKGIYFWDMFSKNGNEVASGMYLWVVKYDGGQQSGTLAIIR